jgi:protein involved in polysaccharide export with SLBB domain
MMRFLLILISLFLLSSGVTTGQNVNPASVDVSALSEAQIQRLIAEMQKRGMTEDQALALARSRGMSEDQITLLQQRILDTTRNNDLSKSSESGQDLDQNLSSDFMFEGDMNYSDKLEFEVQKEEERLFGFQLFNNEHLSFESGSNYPVTDAYQIGVGDEFRIDVYGASQQSYVVIVDKNGQIRIPDVGPVAVGGRSFGNARSIIMEKLALIYRDLLGDAPRTFLNIHLGAIQAINVNVIGEVFAPGTFTLPGTATAFNALFLAGGPNMKGTFRDIQVIRGGKVVHHLDVYEYLINGDGTVNVALNDGDVIMVPTYRMRVRVGGEFIRSGIFESKDGETLNDLINFAGGFNEIAYRDRVELYRNTGRQREMRDVMPESFAATMLQNGDSIYAGKVLDRFTNRISINGAVFRPGTYELSDGMMLSDLIDRADGVREDAFVERGLILRRNKDLTLSNVSFNVSEVVTGVSDIMLQREDVVSISSIDDMREQRLLRIMGEVQRPGSFMYREGLSLGDLILLSGGLKEQASESYIEVTRRLSYDEASQPGAVSAHLFQFSVPRSLVLNSEDAAFELAPFDEVYVRRAPGGIREGSVRVSGEVHYSGEYALVMKNERLSDLIKRSGGFTTEAYLPGAMLTRPISLSAKEQRLRDFAQSQNVGLELFEMDFEVVGVDLNKALSNPGGRDDIYLRDGDELVVPRRNQTIQVGGGVLNPLSMPFIEGRGVKYYVKSSGGFGLRAKRSRTYVIYPNGSAGATNNFLFFRSYPKILPGSEIVVPQKPEKDELPVTAWIAIGSGISTIALTLVTMINSL